MNVAVILIIIWGITSPDYKQKGPYEERLTIWADSKADGVRACHVLGEKRAEFFGKDGKNYTAWAGYTCQ